MTAFVGFVCVGVLSLFPLSVRVVDVTKIKLPWLLS